MLAWPLLLTLLAPGSAPTSGVETLRYEVTAATVEVAELTLKLGPKRIRAQGASSGALLVFFPALEEIEIELNRGRPVRIRRRYNHAGVTGRWSASFEPGRVAIEDRRARGTERHVVRAPAGVFDPASALQHVRAALPARRIGLRIFAGRSIYRLRLERVGRSPLQYRGTFTRIAGSKRRHRRRSVPFWVKALGLNRGATRKPEVRAWFGPGPRYVPRRIRLSNRMGMVQLRLRQDSQAAPRRRASLDAPR